jgi:hypothetical protein
MSTAIHSHHRDGEFHLPHQGMWFLLMLITLMMLLGKSVAATQWVIA